MSAGSGREGGRVEEERRCNGPGHFLSLPWLCGD